MGVFEMQFHHLKLFIYWGSKFATCGLRNRLDDLSYPVFARKKTPVANIAPGWQRDGGQ